MMPHEEIQQLLALSAAGLLEPAEERAIREHVRECAECAERLDVLGQLTADLGSLPAPSAPPDLALRTQARLAVEVAAEADRRQGAILAGASSLFAWALMLLTWYGCRLLVGWEAAQWVMWSSEFVTVLVVALAAAVLGRRSFERRLS